MLRVTIEKVPFGEEELKHTLYTLLIVNDGSGDETTGHYIVGLKDADGKPVAKASVGHHRRNQRNGELRLIERALAQIEAVQS